VIAEPNYLKVEGNRPVIYMGFLNDAIVGKLLDGRWQRFCGELARRGLDKPYLVVCHGNPASAKNYCDRLGGDALSDYNYSRGLTKEGLPFADLAAAAESFWERCEATGLPAVPICMAGFDWRPRVMNPVSWHVCDERYSKRGTPDELASHIGRGVAWYRKHPGKNGTELVLIYAWNELDEAAGWCRRCRRRTARERPASTRSARCCAGNGGVPRQGSDAQTRVPPGGVRVGHASACPVGFENGKWKGGHENRC
jgi:hypothetical protein